MNEIYEMVFVDARGTGYIYRHRSSEIIVDEQRFFKTFKEANLALLMRYAVDMQCRLGTIKRLLTATNYDEHRQNDERLYQGY